MGISVRLFGWLVAALGACAALLFAAALVVAPLHVPLNYNEGWMAFFALRAMHGESLYPPPGGFITDNYPPLSFFLVGGLGRLVGDYVTAGRLLNLASILAAAAGVFASVRRLGDGRLWAGVAALAFLLFDLTYFHSYAGIADPQWTGQALMLLGLPLLLGAPEGRIPLGSVVVSCVAMVCGGFVKHNLIALPLATTLWLALSDRRAFLVWSATAAAAIGAGFALMYGRYGAAPFADIFGHERRILLQQIPDALVYLVPMAPLAAGLVVAARRRWADRRIRLIVLYAAIAAPLAIVQRLGEGINVNAYFELLGALAIGAGAGLASLAAWPGVWGDRRWSAEAAALAILAPLAAGAPYFLGEAGVRLAALPAQTAAWNAVIADAAATPGPAACEMLSLCYWAGKGFELDFFNYGQRLRAGSPPGALAAAIQGARYSEIVLVRDGDYAAGKGRLPAPVPAWIEARYAVVATGPDGTALMRPRPQASPAR